ncbi:MAG: alpha-D-ribose 1-methylphosphonate 5-triphosphate diphosphatase [Rhodobacteraceae bacterium]|jgi:alpha-D-ribose 1-methylphosphonate 5-triphosphate diphosphatase|nr:alpha-D-ribose 1-methylphosphonate 5-triphosphate diphosphatase [Paracoccaceae bacterium]
MTQDLILTNAQLVLEDEILKGTIVCRDGMISDISSSNTCASGRIDCNGRFVAPGLVELHTDNLERHLEPRPAVKWPRQMAVLAHDAELASCGVTTVFDAMRVGSIPSSDKTDTDSYARDLATVLRDLKAKDYLKISHFIHLRAEVCSETLEQELNEFTPDDRVRIISVMDHTPEARQFADLRQLRIYMTKKRGITDQEFEEHVKKLKEISKRNASRHEQAACDAAARLGSVLASHDDTTKEHVRISVERNMTFAEFPTTLEAAQACRDNNIAIMMGAPNLIRGGSHSGNVSALDLAESGLLDILSSDYVPAALFQAAIKLAQHWDDLPRAINSVTKAPALAAGLKDRGTLAIGQRADIIQFERIEDIGLIHQVWSQGKSVF